MSTVRLRIALARRWVSDRAAVVALWWGNLTAAERVLYRAMALLAVGTGGFDWRFGFIVPGVIFALVFFGFRLGRPAGATDDQQPEEGAGRG